MATNQSSFSKTTIQPETKSNGLRTAARLYFRRKQINKQTDTQTLVTRNKPSTDNHFTTIFGIHTQWLRLRI